MFENVMDKKLVFKGALAKFAKAPNTIVLHHSGASADQSVEQIHNYHIGKGWLGIGYNVLVDKNGVVYWGRGIDYVGAQCKGYNEISVGICAIGDMEHNQMPDAQKKSIIKLIKEIKEYYPSITKIVGHKELSATDCPGKNYPLTEIKEAKEVVPVQATVNGPVKVTYDFKALQKLLFTDPKQIDNIPGPITLKHCPTIRKDSLGDIVVWVQNRLKYLGFDCNGVDGIFGADTKGAVKEFQKASGLEDDGIVGQKTWAKLLGL